MVLGTDFDLLASGASLKKAGDRPHPNRENGADPILNFVSI